MGDFITITHNIKKDDKDIWAAKLSIYNSGIFDYVFAYVVCWGRYMYYY
jgi:hypothetical protein